MCVLSHLVVGKDIGKQRCERINTTLHKSINKMNAQSWNNINNFNIIIIIISSN